MSQYAGLGIKRPVLGNDVAESNTLSSQARDLHGMHILAIASPDLSRTEASLFVDSYRKKYGEPKQNFFYPALAYDSANILLQSLTMKGSSSDLRDSLYGMQSYRGVMGDLSFDAKGDVRGVSYGFKVWSGATVIQTAVIETE
jgi:ABC-type branched-subunit amino acid transport system substrate-binding protein